MKRQNQSESTGNNSASGGFFISVFLLVAFLVLPANAAHSASSYVVTETVETLEYEIFEPAPLQASASSSFGNAVAQYGPFQVVAPDRYPGITRIEMLDCDGSVDEEANLELARMIRRAGISTHVPANGSVRSGAVELFLAGVQRTAHPNAEFIVHSWMDEDGREANDYPASDPVHAEYLDQLRLSRNDMARFQLVH